MERATLQRAIKIEKLLSSLEEIKEEENSITTFRVKITKKIIPTHISNPPIFPSSKKDICIDDDSIICKIVDLLKREKIELEKELLEL